MQRRAAVRPLSVRQDTVPAIASATAMPTTAMERTGDLSAVAQRAKAEATPVSACGAMDCFASLAMTMWKLEPRQNNPSRPGK